LYNISASPSVISCVFDSNHSDGYGGAIVNFKASPTLTNCTFGGNTTRYRGGAIENHTDCYPVLTNCILWGNRDQAGTGTDEVAQIFTIYGGAPVVNYCTVQGLTGALSGTGNLGTDPRFENPSLGDYRLSADSPCIDAGSNAAVPSDLADLDGDGNTGEQLPLDILEKPRMVFVIGSGPPIVDMGAFEAQRNTLAGTSIAVQLDSQTGGTAGSITFANVTSSGYTTLTSLTSAPSLPANLQVSAGFPSYYDVATTATLSGPVEVCISYADRYFFDETSLKLLHFDGTAWQDVTTSVNTAQKTICGSVSSLSPFAVVEPANHAPALTCPDPVSTECDFLAGGQVTLVAHVDDAEGNEVSVTWNVDGVDERQEVIPAAAGPTSTDVTFVHSYPIGEHVVTVSASVTPADGSPVVASCTTTVEPVDGSPPTVTCPAPAAPILADASCRAVVPDLTGEAIVADACGSLTITQTPAAGTLVALGSTEVTLTATDTAGNNSSCTTTVTFADATPPTISITDSASGALYKVGDIVHFAGGYSESCGLASASWAFASNLGTITVPATIDATAGTITADYAFVNPGVYAVTLAATDASGNTATADTVSGPDSLPAMVVIYDPTAGFVTGGGWINSPAGAYAANAGLTGKASFGFVSRYKPGANVPDGNTEFQFKAGNLNFKSTAYEWLVVSGARAQFKGSGTINGEGDYRFILTAIDGQVSGGGGSDKFRIRIWGDSGIVYDNQMNAPDTADPSTAIGGGSIVIHK
ncbi:MAG: HYR domain-containing protein, partial [Planctomycetes bacterium]|nr:HYR domain-containing protein [Planctomycetota bacterium]